MICTKVYTSIGTDIFVNCSGVLGYALMQMPWADGLRNVIYATLGVSCYLFNQYVEKEEILSTKLRSQ